MNVTRSVSEGVLLLNAGRNGTDGRGSLYCESLIRGREQYHLPRSRFGLLGREASQIPHDNGLHAH
jgi:hypothetical protein